MKRRVSQLSVWVTTAVALLSVSSVAAALPPLPASFVTEEGGWLTFEYPSSARAQVSSLVEEAHSARTELGAALGRPVLWAARIRLARDPEELSTLVPEPIEPAATSSLDPKRELIALSLTDSTGASLDAAGTLRRELAVLALHEATHGQALPKWLTLGFADDMASSAPVSGRLALISATIRGKLLPLPKLDQALALSSPQRSAVAQAQDFVRFLRKRRGPFAALLDRVKGGEAFVTALETSYGEPSQAIERAWRDQATTRHGYLPTLAMIGLVGASAFGASAWRSRRRRQEELSERPVEPEVCDEETAQEPEPDRVRVVVRRRGSQTMAVIEVDVPKIRHGGSWHTLH